MKKIVKDNIAPEMITFSPLASLQLSFPALAEVTYPDWISGVIFILAGIPCLCIPGVALFMFIGKRCGKRHLEKRRVRTVSDEVHVSVQTS